MFIFSSSIFIFGGRGWGLGGGRGDGGVKAKGQGIGHVWVSILSGWVMLGEVFRFAQHS